MLLLAVAKNEYNKSAISVHITGLVQGVGFRPFVYRLAMSAGVKGWVENNNDGVRIHAEGKRSEVDSFIGRIGTEAPVAAQVRQITRNEAPFFDYMTFEIRQSADVSDEITEISPDIAVCPACISDMKAQPHRLDYPFINCTNCGPRFSIIRGLPYDRVKTTMQPFQMCPTCLHEYKDIADRRFHAQPVACNRCGPVYTLHTHNMAINEFHEIINEVARLIENDGILAIKGTGGFHLACNASSEKAVSRLRRGKVRESKPFAVMFRSIADAKLFTEISVEEANLLESWQRPIVILKKGHAGMALADSVSNRFDTIGCMLPYMPFHYLLFEKLSLPAIVLTSGNLSDEPVIIDDEEAKATLGKLADAVLDYNRDIYNRTDDSVMFVSGDQRHMIRRSRGFAPSPVYNGLDVNGILATGAELVSCFAIGKDKKAILSQHIGDLKNLETLDFYKESLGRFCDMFRVKPSLIACDLHPDYLSTRFAEEYSSLNGNLLIERVQHHHAHIASCMAEHGLDEKVIGIALDGVGYGTDGHIWGFEVLVSDLVGFARSIHLEYVPQPGGDMANHEPWRMALAYLYQYITKDLEMLRLPFLRDISSDKINVIKTALDHHINSPLTSSAGRLFDAVAAMTGICTRSGFHAEAPMRLEDIIDLTDTGHYEFDLSGIINPQKMIQGIYNDILGGIPAGKISARFHRTVVEIIVSAALKVRKETGISKVVLSGGTFQNRFILSESEKRLKEYSFLIYSNKDVPSNDGGIALGQLAIAAKRRHKGNSGDGLQG